MGTRRFTRVVSLPAGHLAYLITQRKKLPGRLALLYARFNGARLTAHQRAEINDCFERITKGIRHANDSPAASSVLVDRAGSLEHYLFDQANNAAHRVDAILAQYGELFTNRVEVAA